MLSIFSELNSRETEIDIIINKIKTIESDLTGASNEQVVVNVLKSTLYMMVYNLIEWIINLSFDELYKVVKQESFPNLTENFQKIIWDNFCSKIEKTEAKKRIPHIIEKIIFSWDIKKEINCIGYNRLKDMKHGNFFWWNVDNKTIKSVLEAHSIKTPHQTKTAKVKYFKWIKDHRNSLSHGESSFGNEAKIKTINEIELEIKSSINFVRLVVKEIQDFLDNRRYANPEKYNISVTYHDDWINYIISNEQGEYVYITAEKSDKIKTCIIYPKIEELRWQWFLKDWDQFFIHLDENFNLIPIDKNK